MKLFAKIKSKDKKSEYSTYIDLDENGEIIGYGCTCIYASYYMWSKKNGEGKKPCWHISHLIDKFKKIKEGKNEEI